MIIETLIGTKYDLPKLGLRVKDFIIDSLAPVHNFESIEGRNGLLDCGTTLEGRTLKAIFRLQGKDKYDYSLLISEIFKLFDATTQFYIIDSLQPKKRWKVRTASVFSVDRLNHLMGDIEISFISVSPYSESIGTTLDPFTFDSELWQVGQGVISEDLVYAHSTTTFRIWNGSDIDVDPRELPLLIKYQGASNNLEITNTITGDVWSYTGISDDNDNITLDGIRSLKNGFTIFSATNRKLITLKKGWNDFTLTGTSGSFLISFDFRFYNI